ncbi:hypothetical protein GH714_032352 [Hevea brasiliensis]|uniref:Integrase catalytic domain-containing protein n=1 Tax=Hevea brasiliensis TaxID=3981 RepID=A0A6A6LDN5_HEVBR|nr:hypothetical protein GH714_032352 [Hevea brasiliensis]
MCLNREQGNSIQGLAHMSTDKTNSFKINPLKFFLCDGPHWARECPTKSALSTLKAIFEEEKKPEEEEEEDRESNDRDASVMGALRILGALEKQKPTATTERGLMYVDLLINGKNARALVDTGATDNFVADTLVTRFKLIVQADAGKIKAVNSQALNTVGVARGVSCQMGPWKGEIDFTVTLLDFDVVIRMEFLKRARAIPVPAADCILLMRDEPCTIPTSFSPISEKKLLSTLQFKRGVKRRELSYVVVPIVKEELPKVGEYDNILVIIDRFSKYEAFVPMSKYCSAEDTARAFFKHIVKYWGIPKSIVSD